MKSIFCFILLVLTWGESVEVYWKMMQAGNYEEAAARLEAYLDGEKRVTEEERAEGEDLIMKALTCQEMKKRAKDVKVIDSIKVKRENMVEVCNMVMGGSRMKLREDGGAEFVAARGQKRLVGAKGQNSYDIYRQYGDGEMEKLSKSVNTEANDNFPYEMADGVTLYFASEGHGSIGGYDIFMARYNSETFDYQMPHNVGMPFNSLGNDYLMMVDDLAGMGLWVTDNGQNGDTVMVYVYKQENGEVKETVERKPLPVVENDVKETGGVMTFYVNDRIVYTRIEDFRNAEARAKYVEMMDIEKEMRLVELVLESKRMNFRTLDSAEEKQNLSNDIVEDERYLVVTKDRLKELTKEIRRLEKKQYE